MSALRRSALALCCLSLASAMRESFHSLEDEEVVKPTTTRQEAIDKTIDKTVQAVEGDAEEVLDEVADGIKEKAGDLYPVKTGLQVGGDLKSGIRGDTKVVVSLRKAQGEPTTAIYLNAKSEAAASTFAAVLDPFLAELKLQGPPRASAQGATVAVEGFKHNLQPKAVEDLKTISKSIGHLTFSWEANMDYGSSEDEAWLAKPYFMFVDAVRADLEGTLTPEMEKTLLAVVDKKTEGMVHREAWMAVANTVVPAAGRLFSGIANELRLGTDQRTVDILEQTHPFNSNLEKTIVYLKSVAQLYAGMSLPPLFKTLVEVVRAAARDLDSMKSMVVKGLPGGLELEVAFTNVKPFQFTEMLFAKSEMDKAFLGTLAVA